MPVATPDFQPAKPAGFEGMGCGGQIGFSNAEREWTEEFDLLAILLAVLAEHDIAATRREDDWLHLPAADLYLRPELLSLQPREPSGVQIASAVAVVHPTRFPDGLFEFQHALGEDTVEALTSGLRGWAEVDLPTLQAAISGSNDGFTTLSMTMPPPTSLKRRVVLGHVAHYAANPAPQAACESPDGECEEHSPFCPCCLLTNSMLAFHDHFAQDRLFGLRLLVVRDENGEISADCRVNGLDYPAGQASLIEYGKSWPGSGFEMRKQYVVIHTDNTEGAE